MSDPDAIIAWYRAQLDDDAASRPPHRWNCHVNTPVFGHTMACNCDMARRWLAEVEAKRRIIAEYELARAERKVHPKDLANVGWWLGTIRVIKLLALPYADRPGYREEWRP